MCKPYSCIFTNEFKVLDHPSSDSHKDIVDLYGLKDNKYGKDREWLRVEIIPQVSLTSLNEEDWEFKLDADRPLPTWYNYEVAKNLSKQRLIDLIKNNRYVSVGGYLDLRNTHITTLLDNLSVGGYLDLSDTNITDIPKNAKIKGNIYR